MGLLEERRDREKGKLAVLSDVRAGEAVCLAKDKGLRDTQGVV